MNNEKCSEKKRVACVGKQYRTDGSYFILVNDPYSHSTISYDPDKHIIVPKEDFSYGE